MIVEECTSLSPVYPQLIPLNGSRSNKLSSQRVQSPKTSGVFNTLLKLLTDQRHQGLNQCQTPRLTALSYHIFTSLHYPNFISTLPACPWTGEEFVFRENNHYKITPKPLSLLCHMARPYGLNLHYKRGSAHVTMGRCEQSGPFSSCCVALDDTDCFHSALSSSGPKNMPDPHALLRKNVLDCASRHKPHYVSVKCEVSRGVGSVPR